MKRTIYILALSCIVAASIVGAYLLGQRHVEEKDQIRQMTHIAFLVSHELAYLRQQKFGDAEHLSRLETDLDYMLSELACRTTYDKLHRRDGYDYSEQLVLRRIKAYRTQYPFTIPDELQTFGGYTHKDTRTRIHNKAETFLADIPAEGPVLYQWETNQTEITNTLKEPTTH